MVALTRLLHRSQDDDLSPFVPTFRTSPMHPGGRPAAMRCCWGTPSAAVHSLPPPGRLVQGSPAAAAAACQIASQRRGGRACPAAGRALPPARRPHPPQTVMGGRGGRPPPTACMWWPSGRPRCASSSRPPRAPPDSSRCFSATSTGGFCTATVVKLAVAWLLHCRRRPLRMLSHLFPPTLVALSRRRPGFI